ncbi:unnamed protein product, partial [marine sediment metagenome]
PSNKFDSIASAVQTASEESTDKVPRKKPGRVTYQPITTSTETTDHIPRKKPGRVKYSDVPPSPNESSDTTTKSEKRIPKTLRHRDR